MNEEEIPAEEHIHLLEVELHEKQKELDNCFVKFEELQREYISMTNKYENSRDDVRCLAVVLGVLLMIILIIASSLIR